METGHCLFDLHHLVLATCHRSTFASYKPKQPAAGSAKGCGLPCCRHLLQQDLEEGQCLPA